jgi:hypothetical protein
MVRVTISAEAVRCCGGKSMTSNSDANPEQTEIRNVLGGFLWRL